MYKYLPIGVTVSLLSGCGGRGTVVQGRACRRPVVMVLGAVWGLTVRGMRRWRVHHAAGLRLVVVVMVRVVVVVVVRVVVVRGIAVARGAGWGTPVRGATVVVVMARRPVTLRHGVVIHRLRGCDGIGGGTHVVVRITSYLKHRNTNLIPCLYLRFLTGFQALAVSLRQNFQLDSVTILLQNNRRRLENRKCKRGLIQQYSSCI